MEVLILAALLGVIPAFIASTKGKSFIIWWIYGTLILIIALPHAIFTSKEKPLTTNTKKCAFCAELIKKEAKICRYCGKEAGQKKQETKKEDITINTPPKQHISVDLFSQKKNINKEKIINMIKDGFYRGQIINGNWFIHKSEL